MGGEIECYSEALSSAFVSGLFHISSRGGWLRYECGWGWARHLDRGIHARYASGNDPSFEDGGSLIAGLKVITMHRQGCLVACWNGMVSRGTLGRHLPAHNCSVNGAINGAREMDVGRAYIHWQAAL